MSELKGKKIVQATRSPPDFASMTAGRAALPFVGLALAISEGNALVESGTLYDPANVIASGLAEAIENSYGGSATGQRIVVNTTDVAKIAIAAGNVGNFVIDVQTINWGVVYFASNLTRYRVIYSATSRIIDTAKKKVVAEGYCGRFPELNGSSPSYDELVANDAALLKKELSTAAIECVKIMRVEMLGL
jgi:hypothetical protein